MAQQADRQRPAVTVGANEAILYGSFALAIARQVAHHLGTQPLPAGYPGGFPQMMAALEG